MLGLQYGSRLLSLSFFTIYSALTMNKGIGNEYIRAKDELLVFAKIEVERFLQQNPNRIFSAFGMEFRKMLNLTIYSS